MIATDGPRDRSGEGGAASGFDPGYVVYGYTQRRPQVHFSADGIVWEPVALPTFEPTCEFGDPERIVDAAARSSSVVLVGEYDDAECESLDTFAWVSRDGRTWQRSSPLGSSRYVTEADTVGVWPVPGGFEMAIAAFGNDEDFIELWASTDGLSWQRTAAFPGFGSVVGAADAQGRRLLSAYELQGSVAEAPLVPILLVTSTDGANWTSIDAPHRRAAAGGIVWRIDPPGTLDARWMVDVIDTDQNNQPIGSSVWASNDLSSWERVRDAAARYPFLAGPVTAISDGPAGIIAVLADGRVYRLVP